MKLFLRFFCLLMLVWGPGELLRAQGVSPLDSIRQQVEAKQYSQAISRLRALMQAYPTDLDYPLFLARVYGWSGQIDSSEMILKGLIARDATRASFWMALQQLYYQSANHQASVDLGQQWWPSEAADLQPWRERYARALERLGRDEEALLLIDTLLRLDDGNVMAQALRTAILQKSPNQISASYLYSSVQNPFPTDWQVGMLEYQRKTDRMTWLARANYGQAFGAQAAQLEGDAYTKWGRGAYQYWNLGVSSENVVFPALRAGAEWFQSLGNGASASLGGRFLKFSALDVWMLTSQLAYTHGRVTYIYRPLAALVNNAWFPNHTATLRLHRSEREQFTQLELQYGTVPYFFFNSADFVRNSAYRVALSGQWRLKGHYFVRPLVLFEYEEYFPEQYRNRWHGQLILSRRF
jgi:YaiO family outer membrane protein